VFIDDAQKNVEAARQIGIHSIHFEGYESLRKLGNEQACKSGIFSFPFGTLLKSSAENSSNT
jgi:hypothetical protein